MPGLNEIAKEAGLNPVEDPETGRKINTSDVLDEFFKKVLEHCAAGETVRIKNFGTFRMRTYKGRTLKSPLMDGGEITFDDTQSLRFHQSQVAKRTLNELAPPSEQKPKKSSNGAKGKKKTTKKKAGKKVTKKTKRAKGRA